MTIGGLYSLGIALSNTFVNVYLWKQSGKFIDLAIYNLSVVTMRPVTFLLAGRLAKKLTGCLFSGSALSFGRFLFKCVACRRNCGFRLVLIGAVLGVGYGFYWLAFNVLTFEITEPETRDFLTGF